MVVCLSQLSSTKESIKQGSHALKPRLNFLSTLSPAFQKDNFLPTEFKIHELEDCFNAITDCRVLRKLKHEIAFQKKNFCLDPWFYDMV